MSDRPSGTSWIQVEKLLGILGDEITGTENEEARKILQRIRQEIIDELNALPWDWR